MTNKEEAKFALISNRAQGFHVYREGRLIQDGGWFNGRQTGPRSLVQT